MTVDLVQLNRQLVEHRKYARAGVALVAYSLAVFAFGVAATGMFWLGILLVALAATFFLFGVGAALLHTAHAARCARRIRTLTRLPVARLVT